MSHPAFFLIASLAGCHLTGVGEAAGPAPAHPDPSPSGEAIALHALATVDVRGAHDSIARVRSDVQALAPAQRAEAAASLRVLSVDSAYVRASVQLAFALQRALDDVDPAQIDPIVHADLDHLQRGLEHHVAVLDALGADLPEPAPGDALHVHAGTEAIVDLDALLDASDPLWATRALLDVIPDRPPEALEPTIELHGARVSAITDDPWTISGPIGGWQGALRRLEPFAEGEAAIEIGDALDALDRYPKRGCRAPW